MFGIKLDDILFDGISYNLCSIKKFGCMVAMDSGSAFMTVPEYMSNILKSKQFPLDESTFACKNHNNITLIIDGTNYSLMPQDWQHSPVEGDLTCKSAIMTLNIAFEMVLVGE